MGLLKKHNVNNEQQQKIQKSENNLQHAKLGKPQETYKGFKKPKKQYATLRTDKTIICKLKALRSLYGDHNVGITLGRLLNNELPKVLTDDKKKIFYQGLVDSYEKTIGDKPNK